MGKEDYIETTGEVLVALPNAMFKVRLENGAEVLGFVSGKIRTHNINIIVGDQVKIELSKYDLTKGRITFRIKGKNYDSND